MRGIKRGWVPPAVFLASLAIAPSQRRRWRSEWANELCVRGPKAIDSLRRDVAWHRQRHPYHPLLSFFAIPFVPELLALALTVAAGYSWDLYSKPSLPYPDADRLVRFQRGGRYLGAVQSVVTAKLVERSRQLPEFEEIATYQVLSGTPAGLRASPNLLPMTGSRLLSGAIPESSHDAMLTYSCWKRIFDGDAAILGSRVTLPGGYFRITGILSPDFFFVSRAICYVAGPPPLPRTAGTVVRLRKGVSHQQAQAALRKLSAEIEPHWGRDAFRVSPLARDRRLEHAWWTLGIFVIATIASFAVLASKRRRGMLFYTSLAVRLVLILATMGLLGYALDNWVQREFLAVVLFHQWLFLLAIAVAVMFTVWDHLRRCPQCLSRVGMPVSFGSWSSMVIDRPATEFVCPKGHGLLFVHEIGQKRDRWTPLDASWRDLFSNR